MKFLHTSDLHIGLRLCEQPMNDEIAYLLDEIAEIAAREGCQAVVIAGDIYDRSNPAPDSVKLFDNFVSNLVKKGLSVIGISGNHRLCGAHRLFFRDSAKCWSLFFTCV